jgi:fucose permease
MPAKVSVSLTRQTIYVLFPILDLIAYYKIKRLRKYLLIFYVGIAIGNSLVQYAIMPKPFDIEPDQNLEYTPLFWVYFVISTVATYALSVYLVRKWSKKWNEQFDHVS